MSGWDEAEALDLEVFAGSFAGERDYECFLDDCRYEWEQAVAGEHAEEAVAVAERAHGVVLTAEAREGAVAALMEDAEVEAGEFDDDRECYLAPARAVFSRSPMQVVWLQARLSRSQWHRSRPSRCPARRVSRTRARPRRSRRLVRSRGDPPRDADPDDDSSLILRGAVA